MPYSPPSGFLERRDDPSDEMSRVTERFHTTADCPRIQAPENLVPVQRPYSAPRCSFCAPN